jgi:hypothetical protein
MDSEVTDLAGIKAVTISTLQVKPTEGAFVDGDKTKLDGIEANADVTDATNVAAAGALMDSEVTNLDFIKGLTKGISDGNVLTANNAVANNDFLRINGTEVEGLNVSEVLTALNVESGADVTDATNVEAAGAVMNTGNQTIAGTKEFSSTISGSITGSAATLTTSRNIGGASFDGSADISIQLQTQASGSTPPTTPTPSSGTMIFDTTTNKIYIYNGSNWRSIDTAAI